MKKLSKFIDIYFLLLIIDVFIINTITILNGKDVTLRDYFMLGAVFLIIIVSYLNGIIAGLLTSSFGVFIYGSYMIYESMINKTVVAYEKYIWLVILPISAFLSGRLSFNIVEMQSRSEKLQEEIKNFVTIDEVTRLNNTKSFYVDLNKEISKAKRHKFNLTIMIIKIQYYEQITTLLGEEKVKNIMKKIGEGIEEATRTEDLRYKIQEDMFGIIMPNTDFKGGELVKNRIKQYVENIKLDYEGKDQKYKLDTKIGLVQYNEKIENSFEFRERAEKELEFDV